MVIIDTGYWLALSDKEDIHYDKAVKISKSLNEQLITTWPVITETCHLLLARRGILSMLRFLESILKSGIQIYEIKSEAYPKIFALIKQYQDLPMDLADASLVLLAEDLGSGDILSTDYRDFKTYKWKNKKPFRNLLA